MELIAFRLGGEKDNLDRDEKCIVAAVWIVGVAMMLHWTCPSKGEAVNAFLLVLLSMSFDVELVGGDNVWNALKLSASRREELAPAMERAPKIRL